MLIYGSCGRKPCYPHGFVFLFFWNVFVLEKNRERRLLLRTDVKHGRDKAISVIYRCRVLEILIVHSLFVSAEMMTCSCRTSVLSSGDPRLLIRPITFSAFRDSCSLEYQYRIFKHAKASYKILHYSQFMNNFHSALALCNLSIKSVAK